MSRKLDRIAVELRGAQRSAVERAALVMATAVRRQIQSATGGDSRMSGVGKKGAKVGVGYDVKGTNNPTALLRARGPLHLIERDTKPHLIFRKNDRVKGKGAGRANRQTMYEELFGGQGAYRGGNLKLLDGGFRKVVKHPGTKGKHPFEHGVTKSRPAAEQILRRSFSDAARKGLRA